MFTTFGNKPQRVDGGPTEIPKGIQLPKPFKVCWLRHGTLGLRHYFVCLWNESQVAVTSSLALYASQFLLSLFVLLFLFLTQFGPSLASSWPGRCSLSVALMTEKLTLLLGDLAIAVTQRLGSVLCQMNVTRTSRFCSSAQYKGAHQDLDWCDFCSIIRGQMCTTRC